jgi:ligand-binding SRPBCC domain-containing protein
MPTPPAKALEERRAPLEYRLEREQYLRAPMEVVFPFFSDAHNLERITPPWLRFRVETAGPIEMRAGARIDYTLRLVGVPIRWRTRIVEWNPGAGFVDEQERGPYALWRHEHRFEAVGDGVLMTDVVRYALPFGLLGRVVHALAVRTALERIFGFRFFRVRELVRNAG